jgi:hypothetical protein
MVARQEWATVDGVTAVALAAASQVEIWSPRVVPGVGEVVGDRPVLAATAFAATLPLAIRDATRSPSCSSLWARWHSNRC